VLGVKQSEIFNAYLISRYSGISLKGVKKLQLIFGSGVYPHLMQDIETKEQEEISFYFLLGKPACSRQAKESIKRIG
jgi:hypothetical protein